MSYRLPLKITYYEGFETEQEATSWEKYFKTAAGRRYLKKVIALEFNACPTELIQAGIE
ncbi:MAG: hypothetical protein WKG06_47195 [Segetibacter sp.]